LGLAITPQDQLGVCNALASVQATDESAAAAYEQLMATAPKTIRPEHAWLYCRAAQQGGLRHDHELDLFDYTFSDAEAARTYYAEREWSFEDLEHAYLQRQADRRPGHFPEILGPGYPARGEDFLLRRAQAEIDAGNDEAALAAAQVLHRLA